MAQTGVQGGIRRKLGDAERKKTKLKKTTGESPRSSKYRKRIYHRLFSLGAGIDLPLLFLIIILLSLGLVMLFSASYAYSLHNFNNSYHFISSQAMFAAVGTVIMMALSMFDYHQYHKFAWPLYILAVIMLAMTVIFRGTPIAPLKGGSASRWLNLGFVEFQPSEIAKLALILVFAHMISQRADQMGNFRKGFLPFMGVLGIFAALIVLERHLSATIIIVVLAAALMVIGGTKVRYLATLGGVGVAAGAAAVLLSDSFAYANERIYGWLDPFGSGNAVDTYQIRQSLYAIGSGQLLGVGLGQSRQKYLYLPEPQNDFIFAIVCEELGFIGALFIIVLFALLIWRGVYVSLHAKDRFGMMIGLGISFQVGLQIILNIAVVTNTIPNTGIGLPFFSYGGTAILILLAEMGVLLQISRSANIEKT